MTRAEALAEAQRRWGKYAHVENAHGTHFVGEFPPLMIGSQNVWGEGDSWEAAFRAAFADADRRDTGRDG